MIIVLYSLLFLATFLLTKSYRYFGRYYSTTLYVSFISLVYVTICNTYKMWAFPTWWIFTNEASELLQAVILFPCTTVIFLRYFPRNKWFAALYFLFFVALYVVMEWLMVISGEINYEHRWNLGWSTVVVALMCFMIKLHEHNRILTWLLTVVVMAFFVIWFKVPLLAL